MVQIYVNIMCVFVLIVLAKIVHNSVFMDERRNLMFLHAVMFNALTLTGYIGRDIAEMNGWVVLNYISNTIIYCSGCTIVFCLLLTDVKRGRKIYKIAVAIEAMALILAVTSPWTHLMFYIDADGKYNRGILSRVLFLFVTCMLAMWLFCLYYVYRSVEQSRVYIFMLGGIEVVALILQMFDANFKVIYIGSAFLLSVYYAFIIETDGRFDKLTGVGSNRYYYTVIDRLTSDSIYSIFLVDANNLKRINDTLGHEAGDKMIIAIGKSLKTVFADKGKTFRIGGDEFVVITKDTGDEFAREMSEAFAEELCCRGNAVNLEITASVGYAMHENDEKYIETLHRADADMYEKKKEYYHSTGRDRRRKTV